MKILDVDLLQDGLQRNMAMLDRLQSETEAIHRSIDGLVQMGETLKGEGGNAILSFYGECHLPFLQFFQLFSMQFKQVLHQMEAALYSLEPDTAGYILEQFLDGELEQGLTFIGRLTASLTDETNSIMDQVSDIIGLPHLDDSGVQEGVIRSKKKRDNTISQLYEFDASQTTALNPIEMDIHTMDQWLSNMEGLFKEGLTDVNFQQNDWVALTSQSRLKVELDARQASLKKLTNILSWEKLQSIYQTLLDYAKPITYGFGGSISKESPFVGSDMIALSCPAPEANDDQQEDVNPFVKSINSFNEMGKDFWNGLDNRAEKAFNSPYDFVNYMTLGATDGIWSGAKDRADKMFESKTDFADYATFGFSGMVKEAVLPEDAFSKEHWQNSFGLATSIFGAGKLITSPTNTGVGIPKNTNIGVTATNKGEKVDINSSWKDLMSDADKITYTDYWNNSAKNMEKTPTNAKVIGSESTWNEFLKYNSSLDVNKSAESYIKIITDQSPWPENYTPKSNSLPIGTKINMAMSPGQDNLRPGGWATLDEFSDVNYVRNNLAVQYEFKPEIDRVNIYEVIKELPVKEGTVGPQIDLRLDKYLPGGGSQEALNVPPPLRMKYLKYIESVPLDQ